MDRVRALISAYHTLHRLHPTHKLLSIMTPRETDILSIDYHALEERYRAKVFVSVDLHTEMMHLYEVELREVAASELTARLERDGLLDLVTRFYGGMQ